MAVNYSPVNAFIISNTIGGNMENENQLKIFISHKLSEHGKAVKKLKKLLNRNGLLADKLKIYISTETEVGENWFKKIHKELDEADMLIYIYCFTSPLNTNDWCNYEIGYYNAKKENKSQIVSIVPYKVQPPSPLKDYEIAELTYDGIMKLFRTIYKNKGVWPELFDIDAENELDQMIKKVLKLFSPSQKPVPLSPRLWITIPNSSINQFKEKKIDLPMESTISGETEAAKKFGYEGREDKVVTLGELPKIAEYKGTLPLYFTILSDTLQKILSNKPGPWRLPPIKVLNDKAPNMLVPAYLQKLSTGDYKFEFIVTQPPIKFSNPNKKRLIDLYNLFIVAWHFRWRVVNKYMHQLNRLKTGNFDQIREQAQDLIKKMKIDLDAVILDSFNRELQFPDDITRNFEGEDKIIMEKIVNSQEGLWSKILPKFEKACDDVDIETLINCLIDFMNMNKTCLITVLKLLYKSMEDIEGEMLF
jgi:hypothetical protein